MFFAKWLLSVYCLLREYMLDTMDKYPPRTSFKRLVNPIVWWHGYPFCVAQKGAGVFDRQSVGPFSHTSRKLTTELLKPKLKFHTLTVGKTLEMNKWSGFLQRSHTSPGQLDNVPSYQRSQIPVILTCRSHETTTNSRDEQSERLSHIDTHLVRDGVLLF